MHLSEMRSKYSNHLAVKTVTEKSNECGISMNQLLEWGSEIKNKFITDNVRAVIGEGGNLIPILLERIVILERNARCHHEVSI